MSANTRWDIGNANGKTTRLIDRAHKENLYIIVPDRRRAQIIAKMARDMGKSILFPVTVEELPFKVMGNAYCMTHDGVLVDDVDSVLERIIGMPVLGAASRGVVGGDVTAIEVDGQRFERADELVDLASHAWSIACCAMRNIGIPADWGNYVEQGLRKHGIDPEKLYQAVSADE